MVMCVSERRGREFVDVREKVCEREREGRTCE